MRINNGGPAVSLDSIVLFPLDDYSIPFQHGVQLHLQGRQAGHGNEPVVPMGEEGAHDSLWIAFYGTVLAVDGELWMWYLGQGPDEHWHQRVCLAKSKDGRHWEKPDLGLVEYHGQRAQLDHRRDSRPRVSAHRGLRACDAGRGPTRTGLAQGITWQGHDLIEGVASPIRVRVDFGGVRPEDFRLYAVYLDSV